jgi:hypothetical protein
LNSTATAFERCANSRVTLSRWPVIIITGSRQPEAARDSQSCIPFISGRCTSTSRQASVVGSSLARTAPGRSKAMTRKPADNISLRSARRTEESSSTRISAGFVPSVKEARRLQAKACCSRARANCSMTGYRRPRNKTLVRCGQSDQGPIYRPERRYECAFLNEIRAQRVCFEAHQNFGRAAIVRFGPHIHRCRSRFAVIRLGNFGVYFLFKVLWRWRYTVSTLKLGVFPATI